MTDATYSVRISSQPGLEIGVSGIAEIYNVSASLGLMHPLSSRASIGAVATGGSWGEFYVGVGPRLSLAPARSTTINITPSLLLYRAGERGNSKAVIDVSGMHRDQFGLSLQATTFRQYYYNADPDIPPRAATKAMIYGGVRLGQKPGRYGMVADGVALGAAFVWLLIACGGGGCD